MKLVSTISINLPPIAGSLFQHKLITPKVKEEMSLNMTDRFKADKIVDCVREKVKITPDKVYVFIDVLRENDGEEAAAILEDELLYHKGTYIGFCMPTIQQPAILATTIKC